MSEELETLIIQLANKLGVTAEYLFGVLAKQGVYENVSNLITWVVFTAISTLTMQATYKDCTKAFKDDEFHIKVVFFAISCLGSIMCLAAAILIGSWITAIMNPEYWALQQLLPR